MRYKLTVDQLKNISEKGECPESLVQEKYSQEKAQENLTEPEFPRPGTE
jgi:hypothetical protein